MMGRVAGRAMGALALSGMLVAGSGVGAWAHECFNASRSEQGNASAGSHSQAWVTVAIADLIAGDVAGGLYSEEDGACIYEAYSATGSPLTFTLMVKGARGSDGVIGAKNKNEWLHSDGKGIDHLFDAYGGAIIGSFEACGVTPPF